MYNGDQDRQRSLRQRALAAAALGHGLLDLVPDEQAKVVDCILAKLSPGKSRKDVFLAMHDQNITVNTAYKPEYDAEISIFLALKQRRQEYANIAAARKKEKLEFEAWKASRTSNEKNRQDTSTKINQVLPEKSEHPRAVTKES